MKFYAFPLLCSLSILCSISTAQIDIKSLITQTNKDTLLQTVKELSGVVPVTLSGGPVTIATRGTVAGRSNAAKHLANKFLSYGLAPVIQPYNIGGKKGTNVYAVQTGTQVPKGKYILCAHYDAISAGADDNASGVAVILEAARLLSKNSLNYSLVYALFDQEEVGECGSHAFVDSIYAKRDSILGVVDAEMCAWDSDNDGLFDIHSDDASMGIAKLLAQLPATDSLGLKPVIYNPSSASSDWLEFIAHGYKAVCYSEAYNGGDFNPHYHLSSDKIQYFNVDYFLKQAQLGIAGIATLASTTPPPLAIQLGSFTATLTGDRKFIQVNWTTLSETNNFEFIVQRKAPNSVFKDWRHVPGHGTTTQPWTYTVVDSPSVNGTYSYKLKQVDLTGQATTYGPVSCKYTKPRTVVAKNYPNPFNPATTITYAMSEPATVSLTVYDVLGREVAQLVTNEAKEGGEYRAVFDGRSFASGTYFYRLIVDGEAVITDRMILTK